MSFIQPRGICIHTTPAVTTYSHTYGEYSISNISLTHRSDCAINPQ
ncbi:uncharacterized protein CLUP02_03510 [Colletotrichum lupini]|uniref:Uncharacterized protein n=1 Tax=Colletotrichum lupini TaxID=145971 RepID=A0A9Q8WCE7_9PEZI|nr:uncharacterized protein CLUP02_03510 [Colletotrichum lupini]UQC78036.1 hypothetical protein CLUP02_03510 [Colletotrichum lupini]